MEQTKINASLPTEEETEDPGVIDMGQTLQVLRREGNTLSPLPLKAWEGKECLQVPVNTNKTND